MHKPTKKHVYALTSQAPMYILRLNTRYCHASQENKLQFVSFQSTEAYNPTIDIVKLSAQHDNIITIATAPLDEKKYAIMQKNKNKSMHI